MAIPLAQNFFKETVATAWTAGAGNFYVSTKPVNDTGYLVISPANSSLREIVKFTAVGTDGGGDFVTITAANRGLGGTTDQAHAVGEDVYMNVVAEHLQEISDAIDQIVAAGAQYADENQIGITKMNTAPNNSMGTVTMTIASPAVFTFASHALDANDIVKITTDGSLPTGITANTKYYVISSGLTTNTFQLSATLGGAAINTSGSQSGTHTLIDITPKAIGPDDPALPSTDQAAALAGGGDFGTPDADNKFTTEEYVAQTKKSLTAGETINGGTLPVPVYQNKTDNELYACDADDNTKYKFIGFATTNGTDGNPITLQTNGIVGGFTGLDEGEKYYVQDTAGTIGTTTGTQEILVGVAISQTEIIIQKGRRYNSGTGSFSATGTDAVTIGFRPSKVRIRAFLTSNVDVFSDGTWINGDYACTFRGDSNGSQSYTGQTTTSYIAELIFDSLDPDRHRFTITSVTDTGFTISNTKTGNVVDVYYLWEAEGEL
jgi:hypothetical protein